MELGMPVRPVVGQGRPARLGQLGADAGWN